jgi:hypothetical protein
LLRALCAYLSDRRKKSVSSLGQRFDVMRMIRVVVQRLAQLADG